MMYRLFESYSLKCNIYIFLYFINIYIQNLLKYLILMYLVTSIHNSSIFDVQKKQLSNICHVNI
jgi:hypothetical protein